MEIVFLGTSCMVPTKERNHQSLFIKYREDGLLIDCGEGTQRQLKLAELKPTKVTKIFISHWHGDHVFGLPGLLQTLNASEYERKLEIYGPIGTRKNFKHLFDAFSLAFAFPYTIKEIKNTKLEFKDLVVMARVLEHSIPCLGYSFVEKDKRKIKINYVKKHGVPEGPLLGQLQENKKITWNNKVISPDKATYLVKGKKISVILDTVPCNNAYRLAKDADVLICEAVYSSDLLEKAQEYMHLTAEQAALLASQSNVKKLILTHFSQRYKTTEKILKEAKTIFKNTYVAHDLMKLKV